MIATLYYLSTIFFIWGEITWLYSPIEKTKDMQNFFKLSKLNKGKKWNEFSKEFKSELNSKLWNIIIAFWMFLGLFTFQWAGYIAIILFNFLIIGPISKLTKYTIFYTILHWINSLIGLIFGIFVIINHFHLRIDLTKLFLSLL